MPNSSSRSAKENAGLGSSANQDGINTTVISPGSRLDGNFQCSENVRFDGQLLGDLSCEKKLVIGKDGKVEGSIKAREAVIMGKVQGNISISGALHLDKHAVIRGNITAGVLSIEDGAVYDGSCKTGIE